MEQHKIEGALRDAVEQAQHQLDRIQAQLSLTKYFDRDKLDYAVVGDFERLKSDLRQINVYLYDEED